MSEVSKINSLYDTQEKKLKFVRSEGNVITFKEDVKHRFTSEIRKPQIFVAEYVEGDSGVIEIRGFLGGFAKFENIDALLNSIDWEWMEKAHNRDPGNKGNFDVLC